MMDRKQFFADFIDACKTGCDNGWHACGGGSLSMRLDSSTLMDIHPALDLTGEYRPLGIALPELSREFFLVTGNNLAMKDAYQFPDMASGMIQISPDGSGWRTVLGFADGDVPMGSLPIQMMCHAKRSRGNGTPSVVYHCHPVNLIALTYLVPLEDESMTKLLQESFFLCEVLLKDGVGVLTKEQFKPDDDTSDQDRFNIHGRGAATIEKLAKCDLVIWPQCGIVCWADHVKKATKLVEAVETAAEIRLKLMAAGH